MADAVANGSNGYAAAPVAARTEYVDVVVSDVRGGETPFSFAVQILANGGASRLGTTPGVLLICTFSQVSLRSSSSWTTSPSITRRSTRLRLSFLAATISSAQSLLPTTPGTELACAGPTLRKRRPKSSTLTVSRFDRSHPAEADETLPRRQLGNDPLLPPSPSRAPVQGPRGPGQGGDSLLREPPRL